MMSQRMQVSLLHDCRLFLFLLSTFEKLEHPIKHVSILLCIHKKKSVRERSCEVPIKKKNESRYSSK